MPRKRTGKGTKRAGAKKTEAEPTMDLTVPAVALTKQLAEAMRWRSMEWARIPALTRKLTMPYLTARDTINLDTAVSDNEERKAKYFTCFSPTQSIGTIYEINRPQFLASDSMCGADRPTLTFLYKGEEEGGKKK